MRKAVTLVCSVFLLAVFVAACDAPDEGGAEPADQQQQDFQSE